MDDPADKLKDKLISQLIAEKRMYESISETHISSIEQINERVHKLSLEKAYKFVKNEDDTSAEYLNAIGDVMNIIGEVMKQDGALTAAIIKHNTGVDPTKIL